MEKSPACSRTSPGGTERRSVWLWVSEIQTKRTVFGALGSLALRRMGLGRSILGDEIGENGRNRELE